MKLRGKILVGLAALGLLGGGLGAGEAFASIPDGSGVIHGCYESGYGTLHIIDSATQTCPTGSTSLNWTQNQPTTTFYVNKTSFSMTNSGGYYNETQSCNTGDTVTGGGIVPTQNPVGHGQQEALFYSGPADSSMNPSTSDWTAQISYSGSGSQTAYVYADCVHQG